MKSAQAFELFTAQSQLTESVAVPVPARFAQLWVKLTEEYSKRGVDLLRYDLPKPFFAAFNGVTVVVDVGVGVEFQSYMALHLFSHVIQWSLDSRMHAVGGIDFRRRPATASEILELERIELGTVSYGRAILRHVGESGLDQWLWSWTNHDFEAFKRFLRHAPGLIPLSDLIATFAIRDWGALPPEKQIPDRSGKQYEWYGLWFPEKPEEVDRAVLTKRLRPLVRRL